MARAGGLVRKEIDVEDDRSASHGADHRADLLEELPQGLGIGKGDRVAIVSENRVEWAVAAYATYGLEAAFVPTYPGPGHLRGVRADSDARPH
jgi:long-subunit acyl-CoA synthetase (AMP-forming)